MQTLGCRLNQAETDSIGAALEAAGHDVAAGPAEADVFLLNSCTITHQADADARRVIRRALRANPNLRVVVTGCYANAEPEAVAALPGVDAVVGNADKASLTAVVDGLAAPRTGGEALVEIRRLPKRPAVTDLPAALPRGRTRALLKVQDGCNYRCAFCIVPSVRGGSRSLPVETAVAQMQALIEGGAREIVLTGIHLGTYGRDLRPRRTLVDLVVALLDGIGPARLRLSSLDPHEVDDRLIELLATKTPSLCRHLHLPVQSGDEDVLRAMRRGHTAEDFERLCERLLDAVPGISIGTDVIVGFPQESDEAFARTEAVLSRFPLAYHHVFTYSERRGTAAAQMSGSVPSSVRSARNRVLRTLSATQAEAFARASVGERPDVIALRGGRVLTDNYLQVPWRGRPIEPGTRLRASIELVDGQVIASP